MTGLYDKYVLPKIIHCVCGLKPMMRQREKIVPLAAGNVLEIGVGSGHNLSYYDPDKVRSLMLVDPTPDHSKLQQNIEDIKIPTEFEPVGAESIPTEDSQFDTIVATYTLCTIPDLQSAFSEIRRVIKPNGQVLFIEHGLAPDTDVQRSQNLINPLWQRLAGGCHLNRDIQRIFNEFGFRFTDLDKMYLPGWKPATYNLWGRAIVS